MRLNKAMAELGICSRRTADYFIANGMVKVNNLEVKKLGTKVNLGDVILVNGIKYVVKNRAEPSVWLYNKPVGLVTSHRDEKGRDTVFDAVRNLIDERVISVGRLDINSEGLLLLTNSGEFARYAENPRTGWERHYRVRTFGNISDEFIKNANKGIVIGGVRYAPVQILVQSHTGKHYWYSCILKEGKNREVRKIFNSFGVQVSRLIRTKYGPYELKDIPLGNIRRGSLISHIC